jgi:hypothetical protein
MSYLFEHHNVPVDATAFVQDLIAGGRGGSVYGATGSGKSHAVREAVHGVADCLWVDVTDGPLLGLRFLADLARQVGPEGRPILEAVRHDGIRSALAQADGLINGHSLVVDRAHLLLGMPPSLDDPAMALWQEDKFAVLGWLRERTERTPTILVGRRSLPSIARSRRHAAPMEWPIVLTSTPDGFRDWPLLARLAHRNPAALTLAHALIPFLSAPVFNEMVTQAETDEVDEREMLRRLGGALQSSAPPSWQLALALVSAVGEIPSEALAAALDPEPQAALGLLEALGLVERRPGGLSVLPSLLDAGAIRPLTAPERAELMPEVARHLLTPIDSLLSLDPEHADRVLRAHAIFVELGDMANAERTASLHVHGLVDLARRTSLGKDFKQAWQQYDSLWRLLSSGTFGAADDAGRHLVSYVRHYRAWNGHRAGAIDDALCLREYQESLRQWPENALWHQRTIDGLIRQGLLQEARTSITAAYEQVPEHPRRDELLRARPARTAMIAGAPILSLELIEPVLELPAEQFPGVAQARDALIRRWEQGVALSEISYGPTAFEVAAPMAAPRGLVVFLRETHVTVRKTASGWVARLPELAADRRANAPLEALRGLGASLASELYHLISTPSSQLGGRDLRRKGSLVSLVDSLNSDIGLEHAEERWLIGRIDDERFIPVMRDLPAAEVPTALLPESTAGLYFARVGVYRDGAPCGPVQEIKFAGRGRTLDELLDLLAQLSQGAS